MSLEAWRPIFRKHHQKGLLLDTNLFLLYYIGSINPNLIPKFKRTANQGFGLDDFNLMKEVTSHFTRIVTTPHILTEVSNLLGTENIGEWSRHRIFQTLSLLIRTQLKEKAIIASSDVARTDAFLRFGLTDAAISRLSAAGYLVATVDFPLIGWLRKNSIEVLNFTQLREEQWT